MELTNHTYLRSRVDLQIANSLRKKASDRISAGGMTNAVDDAGGFSAAVKLKANQYQLQAKRSNIQNSLSFLQAQREVLSEAVDLIEKVAMIKMKSMDITLNDSDRANFNREFVELSEELAALKSKSFNGVSLFAPASSGNALYGGDHLELQSTPGTDGNVSISKHVVDLEDIRFITEAGEALNRGIGGLKVVNFAEDGVKQQQELITIGGSIADGDIFSLGLTEQTSLLETESENSISVVANAADEASGDPQTAVRDKLITSINNAASSFLTATAVGTNQIALTSNMEGDPFVLHSVNSSGTESDIQALAPSTAHAPNDAEERTITLDFRHDGGKATGIALKVNDEVSVEVDGTTYRYRATATDVQNVGGNSTTALSDPEQYQNAAFIMAAGLRDAINASAPNVSADNATINGNGASLRIRSTVRGDSMNLAGTGAISINQNEVVPTATTFNFSLSDPSRTLRTNDRVQIQRTNANGSVNNVTFNYNGGGPTGFTSWNDLATKIGNYSWFQSASITGNTMTVTANVEDVAVQPQFRARQLQNDDSGSVLTDPTHSGGTFVKETNWNSINTVQGSGSGLTVDLVINNTSGFLDSISVDNAGSGGYIEGENVRVRGNALDGDFLTHDYVVRIDDVRGQVQSNSGVSTGQARGTYSYNGLSTSSVLNQSGSASGAEVNVTTDAGGNITNSSIANGGSGYTVNDTFTVAAADLGGGSASLSTFMVTSVNASNEVDGIALLGGNGADKTIFTGLATTSNGAGTGATYTVATNNDGSIAGIAVSAIGNNYRVGEELTIAAADLGGGTATDVKFTITSLVAGTSTVNAVSYVSGQAKMSFVDQGVAATGGSGSGLALDVTTNRLGAVTDVQIQSQATNGQNYSAGNVVTVNGASLNGGTAGTDNLSFTINDVESDWTNLYNSATGGASWKSTDPTNVAYDAAFGTQGLQRIADKSDAAIADSENTANDVGVAKVMQVAIDPDSGSGGAIAVGDQFTINVNEVLHSDESSATWPETAVKTADSFSVTHTAAAGETAEDVRNALVTLLTAEVNARTAAEQEHIPSITADPTDVQRITFTAGKPGENFNVTVSYVSQADSMTSTTTQENVSPFSTEKSIKVLQAMLAQNAAETSRLNSAQESLENHIINSEQAWGRITDTDYAKESTALVKNNLNMQMANDIISKSVRMKDLLISLTTDHHRSSVMSGTL